MKVHRRLFLSGLVLPFLTGARAFAAEALSSDDKPLFTFMQFSDVHVGHPLNLPSHTRLIAAVELANALKPAFVINSGDLTTHPVYAPSEEYLAEYDQYKKYMTPLTMPLYDLPGNHDIGYFDPGDVKTKTGAPWGDYKQLVTAYCRAIGPLDQSFVFRGVGFILFNNNPPYPFGQSHVSEEQIKWIESELKKYKRAFLFCHVQLLEEGMGSPWGESAERLAALCRQYNVDAVAGGHIHSTHVKAVDGTQYITCSDLKNLRHEAVYQYRVFPDRFELWQYNVFSHKGFQVGNYPSSQSVLNGSPQHRLHVAHTCYHPCGKP